MTKTKILAAVLASLACVALLGSCDYWKEDYYKNGGDSGSQASGGSGSTASSIPTYSGSMTVNGASYTTLAMNGTSTSGTATLSGAAGSLSGTYARAVATAAVASEFTGSYTITFSSGTITVTFNGNGITLTNGSITASGTATLVAQASGGSTAGSGGSGGASSYTMNAEEQSVFNSLVGSWKDDDNEIYTIHSNGTIDSSRLGTATWSKARVKSAALNDLSGYGSDEDNFFGIIEAGCYFEGVWFDDSFGRSIFRESDGTYKLSGHTRM